MSARQLASRLRTALARRFGVDARALAAFRIALGGLLLADLLLRARSLTAFYTDSGVLPRSLLAERAPLYAEFSLHALSGAAWLQAVLFAVAGVAALALLVGYRTKLATVLSVALLASLHARNPYVLNGGDVLFRQLLFWSVFLPLGARWSVDAQHREATTQSGEAGAERGATGAGEDATRADGDGRRVGGDSTGDRVVGVASAALLAQVVLVYVVNGLIKLRGDSWVEGDAIRTVFSLDQFTVLLGETVAQYPALLEALSHLWLVLLVASPLLLVLGGWWRAAFAALFVGAHVGMLLTMRLGLFPLISVAAFLPFLPAAFWDRVPVPSNSLAARLDDALPAFEGRLLPARLHQWAGTVLPPALACLLAFVLLWNAATLGYVAVPDSVNQHPQNEAPDQRWNMFAPEPLSVDGWLVAPGELESGERVDAFYRSSFTWERPADLADTYPSARWRKFVANAWRGDGDTLERGFAGYLCGRWNENHEDDLVNVTLYYVTEETRFDGPEPTERVKLFSRSCPAA